MLLSKIINESNPTKPDVGKGKYLDQSIPYNRPFFMKYSKRQFSDLIEVDSGTF